MMTVNSEAKYEMTTGEIEMANKEIARHGLLLSLPPSYWEQFVDSKGKVDKKKLKESGYDGDGQPEWIESEMKERGWLGGEGGQSPDVDEETLLRTNVARAIERDEEMAPKPKGEGVAKPGSVEAALAKSKEKSKEKSTE